MIGTKLACCKIAVLLTVVVLILGIGLSGCRLFGGDEDKTYSISGKVIDSSNDEGIEGVTISFTGGHSSVDTASNGSWSKSGLSGSVTVTPSKDGYSFDPSNRQVSGTGSNVNFTGILDIGLQTPHTAGGVDFNMRLAPAATFPTGTNDSGTATVDDAFWVAETQVTYALWYAVRIWAEANGYTFANAGREGSHGDIGQVPTAVKKNEPVTNVTWRDSIVWCNALSEMLGYIPVYTYQGAVIKNSNDGTACDNAVQENRNGFRLPTSDEWELAARYKGNDSSYGAITRGGLYWTPGNYASGATADYNNATATQAVAWYSMNNGVSTMDVYMKNSNLLGLYDMSGNVWEWTFTQSGTQRVRRGGSFSSPASELQVGNIDSAPQFGVSSFTGFRLVRTF